MALFAGKRNFYISVAIFLAVTLPVIITGFLRYQELDRDMTQSAITRRRALAHLASNQIEVSFDNIIDLGVFFSRNAEFQQFIAVGKWDKAIQLLGNPIEDFPWMDNIALFNPEGTMLASIMPLTTIGQNFSFRDYYKGVSKNWQPYISEIFERTTEPAYNLFVAAIPIKSTEDGKILGIMNLSVKIYTVLDWAREINEMEVNNDTFIHFIDQYGHATEHTAFSDAGKVIDVAGLLDVQKALKGENGVGIFDNFPEKGKAFSAYQSVSKYGWGVIVHQPAASAFAARDKNLRRVAIFYGISILLNAILGLIIARIFLKLREAKIELENKVKDRTAELTKAKAEDDAMLASIGDGLIVTDKKGAVILMNPAAEKMLGWKASEIVGRLWLEMVPMVDESGRAIPKEERVTSLVLSTTTTTTTTTTTVSCYYIRKNRTKFPVAITAAPVTQNNIVIGAVEVFRDITQEKEIDRLKTEFVSLASHQLRTPITAIQWVAERFLKKEKLTARSKESINNIRRLAKRLNILVSFLLDISRLEMGRVAVLPKPLELVGFINAFLKEYAPLTAKKNLKLIFIKHPPSLNAVTDHIGLSNIFNALISNAIEYTPKGGSIDMAIEKKENSFVFSIRDTGIGIPRDEQTNIFKRFFRGSNASVLKPNGTGLGLYLVLGTTKLLGGKVWFESEIDKGSIFFIELPLIIEPKAGEVSLAQQPITLNNNK